MLPASLPFLFIPVYGDLKSSAPPTLEYLHLPPSLSLRVRVLLHTGVANEAAAWAAEGVNASLSPQSQSLSERTAQPKPNARAASPLSAAAAAAAGDEGAATATSPLLGQQQQQQRGGGVSGYNTNRGAAAAAGRRATVAGGEALSSSLTEVAAPANSSCSSNAEAADDHANVSEV